MISMQKIKNINFGILSGPWVDLASVNMHNFWSNNELL